jgi:hypothetical protein
VLGEQLEVRFESMGSARERGVLHCRERDIDHSTAVKYLGQEER